MNDHNETGKSVAERLAALAARDAWLNSLGVSLVHAAVDRVTIEMTVAEQHMNFNGTCHGGVMFSLADTAFGLASNARGVIAAAVHADIAFCAPVGVGDRLTAEAIEVSRSRRVGTYRVDVKSAGRLVATFTGTVHVTERPHAA
ncbi:MAG: hotdog fold thioesterase [Gammaproteobacteria bacterium]|nr:hotdog fold thioesterase [Gammaproteobacteria bacterium]